MLLPLFHLSNWKYKVKNTSWDAGFYGMCIKTLLLGLLHVGLHTVTYGSLKALHCSGRFIDCNRNDLVSACHDTLSGVDGV